MSNVRPLKDTSEHAMGELSSKAESKGSVRARANRIKGFRCKNLIVVVENPEDVRNIGTVIRNVNALGAEKV